MPGKAEDHLWAGLWPIERDEVLTDLVAQAATRQGTPAADLLQRLTRPVTAPPTPLPRASKVPHSSSTSVITQLTPALATHLARLHHQAATAVTACRHQARQQARARRRRILRRILAPFLKPAAAALAGLLFWLAMNAQRDERRTAADAAQARTQLAAARQELDQANNQRAALDAEISQVEPLARAALTSPTNAAAPGLPLAPPSQTGSSAPGNAREQILQLQQQVRQRTEDRDQLQRRWAELQPRLLEAMPGRLATSRQALAEARQTWQQLETDAKALPQAPSRELEATNPLQQALQTIAAWQTRLAEQDRLMAEVKVTPANLTEADRLVQNVEKLLAETRVEAEKVRGSLANWALPAGLRTAFTLPSGATDAFGNAVVRRGGRDTDPASGLPLELVHRASGLVLVLVPAGEFQMGSPANEADRFSDEGPVHAVRFGQPFYLGKYEVTQDQWQKVLGDNPSQFKVEGRRPVETVSWQDAQRLVGKLNESLQGTAGWRFGLPSEAQWEYACRAGSTGRYAFGDEEARLGEFAWYSANSRSSTHPVGQKKPNAWGLYDLHGNVWEWCEDLWHGNYEGAPTDGRAWTEGGDQNARVLRGGSLDDHPWLVRAADRFWLLPDDRSRSGGVRVVLGVGARTP
jgi:formylglycine-generating enzyme required for sulfatase activity